VLYNSGGALLYNSGGSNPIWACRVVMHRVPRAVRRAAAPPRRVSVKGAGRERALNVVGAAAAEWVLQRAVASVWAAARVIPWTKLFPGNFVVSTKTTEVF
jgi:hypothetical protein